MRIRGMEIEHFGAWSGLKLDDLPQDLVVFYGPNEAGKTTLMQYVRTVLFGFATEESRRYVKGPFRRPAGRIGGRLRLATHEGHFYVSRYAQEHDPDQEPGELRVTTLDGARAGGYRLEELLDGVDQRVFNNVFAIGLDEIQQLSALGSTQAAQYLYSLSTGSDRVSLVDVMYQLRAARQQLLGTPQQQGLLPRALAERDKHAARLEQLADQTQVWSELKSQLRSMDEEVQHCETRRDQLRNHLRVFDTALRVHPKWNELKKIDSEVAALGEVRDIPDNLLARVEATGDRASQRQHELDELRRKRNELAERADKLPVREVLLRQSARVEVLVDQKKWIASLEQSARKLDSQLDDVDLEIQAELERLGLPAGGEGRQIDGTVRDALREPARRWKRARSQLAAAKRDAAQHKSEAANLQKQIEARLGADDPSMQVASDGSSRTAESRVDSLASKYRRRKSLAQELQELNSQDEQFQRQRVQVLARQFLPKPVLITFGIAFAVGATLTLCALFHAVPQGRRSQLLLLGCSISVAAVLLKWLLDGRTRRELRALEQRRDRLHEEIRVATAELESLGGSADPADGDHAGEIREAEQRLDRVEQLLPLDRQRLTALDHAKSAEKQAIAAATELRAAREAWGATLQRLGLPSDLTPPKLQSWMGKSGPINRLRAKHKDLRHQRDLVHQELASLQARVVALYRESGLTPPSESPLSQLEQLVKTTQSQKELVRQRDALRREVRQLQRDEVRLEQAIVQLQRKRQSLVASVGVVDEEELVRVVKRRETYLRLNEQKELVQRDLILMYGNDVQAHQVESELARHNATQLLEQQKQLQQQLEQMDQQLKQRLQARGELAQKIKALEEDETLAETQLKLAGAQHKLTHGLESWKVMSAITSMLKSVYRRYEKDRQPHTLRQASELLSRMTAERYHRVWTPLAEDVLLVDGQPGEALPLVVLSRGTREQIFLALRLALVADYGRRGMSLPMVLDDVLVNFDAERARAAAEVLHEFARSGHQMFLFTCHEHIMNIFQELGAEVRSLPRSVDVEQLLRVPSTAARAGADSEPKRERRRRIAALATADRSDAA